MGVGIIRERKAVCSLPMGRGHCQYSVIREVVADLMGLLFTKGARALFRELQTELQTKINNHNEKDKPYPRKRLVALEKKQCK